MRLATPSLGTAPFGWSCGHGGRQNRPPRNAVQSSHHLRRHHQTTPAMVAVRSPIQKRAHPIRARSPQNPVQSATPPRTNTMNPTTAYPRLIRTKKPSGDFAGPGHESSLRNDDTLDSSRALATSPDVFHTNDDVGSVRELELAAVPGSRSRPPVEVGADDHRRHSPCDGPIDTGHAD